MAEIRGCDLVVEYLLKEKVPYLFGYAGHGAVGLLDGVYNHQDELKIIFPRIESAAGYMADAYYRASGQVIPVYTSTGPGPMLLTVAMGNAFYDSSAFIAITGQVATNQYDSGALQEEYRHYQADFPSIAKVISKRSFQAQSVEDLGKFLPKAFKLATTGRPGPVHIDVPYDLWIRTADAEVPEPEERSQMLNWRTPGSPEAVARALEMLLKAKRPLILAGGGVICSDATEQLQQFAEHVNVPVYSTFMGKGALSARHPLHLGIAGCWGEYPASEAAKNADVILAIGCRFSDIHCSSWVPGYTYNIPPTKLIHVDLDPQEIGRNYPTEIGIVGDAREVLKQLLELSGREPKRERSPWHDQIESWKEEWSNFIEPEKASNETPIDPRRVICGVAQGSAGRHVDDHRHGEPPDVGGAVLGCLRAALGVHAGRVRRHGLRHVRRPRRQAGSPRPAGRVRDQRRQLHDVPRLRRDRRRARHPGDLGDHEQLHDRRHPRPPAVLHGQPRDRDDVHEALDR